MNFFLLNSRLVDRTVSILFFLLSITPYWSQNVDSLQQAYINAKHDSTRCKALSTWAEVIYIEKPDSAVTLWTNSMNLAEKQLKLYSKKEKLYAYYSDHVASALNNIAAVYTDQDNFPKAKEYNERALKIREDMGDRNAIAGLLNNIGAIYLKQGDMDKAIEYGLKALKIRQETGEKEGIANSLNNLGFMFSKQGNIARALDYYHQSLKISTEMDDKHGIAFALHNIGAGLQRQGELESALDYYRKCLKIREEIKDKNGIASTLTNIGVVYEKRGYTDKALEYYEKALKGYEEAKGSKGIANCLNNIGTIYNNRNELEKALDYYDRAFTIKSEIGDKPGIARVLTDISKVWIKQGKLNEALQASEKALILARESGQVEYISIAAERLKDIYQKKGDAKNALAMYELHVQMRDSIENQETRKASIRTQFQYEYDKKEAVLKEQQDKEQKLSEEKSSREKITTWSVIIVLALVLIFTVLVYYRLRIARKQKQLIEKQKIEVERQKELIDKKNSENELLLGEIHHRVKNNLQVISSLLSLQERSMESGSAKSAIHEGKERVKSMELVHKMLYQGNSFSGIEMNAYVNKLSLGLIESFGIDKKDVELNAGFKPITLDVDTAIPLGLILNELIINSLKHAKSATEKLALKIEIHETETSQLQVSIADNGKGRVSEIEASDSFGLKIIRALVRQLDGVMVVKEDRGINYVIALNNYKLIA